MISIVHSLAKISDLLRDSKTKPNKVAMSEFNYFQNLVAFTESDLSEIDALVNTKKQNAEPKKPQKMGYKQLEKISGEHKKNYRIYYKKSEEQNQTIQRMQVTEAELQAKINRFEKALDNSKKKVLELQQKVQHYEEPTTKSTNKKRNLSELIMDKDEYQICSAPMKRQKTESQSSTNESNINGESQESKTEEPSSSIKTTSVRRSKRICSSSNFPTISSSISGSISPRSSEESELSVDKRFASGSVSDEGPYVPTNDQPDEDSEHSTDLDNHSVNTNESHTNSIQEEVADLMSVN